MEKKPTSAFSSKTTGNTNILVTGAAGQLGSCFKKLTREFSKFHFLFASSNELDITSKENLRSFFEANKIDVCINCAAYTNVEKAESEKEKAFLVNVNAVKNLAEICKEKQSVLVHFSTDYVFNGKATQPYDEKDPTDPINVYGASKLAGENHIQQIMKQYFIFRTSWLYSEFGNNFYTAMLKKAQEKGVELNITTEQTGTPTNANDLAFMVLQLIAEDNKNYGLYHYSNLGQATWYDFAKRIFENANQLKNVNLHPSDQYRTIAKRPNYSVLSKYKTATQLKLNIPFWEESLKELQNT